MTTRHAVRRMTTKAQSSSELCPLSCKSVYRLCSRRKSSVRQSMQVQCQTKRASPVSNKACKSSVKQSMQVQCQTKHASPVSDKACKSSVKQSMQVQCQLQHASPVSNDACKSSIKQSMQQGQRRMSHPAKGAELAAAAGVMLSRCQVCLLRCKSAYQLCKSSIKQSMR